MRTRTHALLALLPFAILALSCSDSGNTTNINQGLDCGLIRSDLLGDWTVSLAAGQRSLQDCTGTGASTFENAVVTTGDFPATYAGADIFGSEASSSYQVLADRTDSGNDTGLASELTGTVQADSCLALLRAWDATDSIYFQCFGSLTISNGTITGACDSAEIDSDGGGGLDTSCSLSASVIFSASIQ